MTNGHNLSEVEQHAQALRWLDLLAELLPETVKIEVSSGLSSLPCWRFGYGVDPADQPLLQRVAPEPARPPR